VVVVGGAVGVAGRDPPAVTRSLAPPPPQARVRVCRLLRFIRQPFFL
jgi:hypothetical protein